jgi:hypothetical protein
MAPTPLTLKAVTGMTTVSPAQVVLLPIFTVMGTVKLSVITESHPFDAVQTMV